jgi:saccharopine dehydrogenase (NAD+, L-lysine-forming)
MTINFPRDPKYVPEKMSLNLHLRSETGKALDRRSALTPTTTKALIDAGYKVNVERSPQRIFDDEEFEKVGATLVEENSWPNAPEDHIIIGLKELPAETCESVDAGRLHIL